MIIRPFTYFVSDVHLGLDFDNPQAREQRFVSFLQGIDTKQTESLYMVGDIWDFWYEYNDLIPKGYYRVFSALERLIQDGVKVYFIRGNHDAWLGDFFQSMGIIVLEDCVYTEIFGLKFCIAHGDGLGKGLYAYKFMKAVFASSIFRFVTKLLPPDFVYFISKFWSKKSRLSRSHTYEFKDSQEPLYLWAEAFSRKNKVDHFIFGHFHLRKDILLDNSACIHIMKDWVHSSNYLRYDSVTKEIKSF